ncbi:GFA family protein [Sphingomonas mesophila]|uniref:GFA family protein n=1 Tax=Sphingomonas mesophila TaxID=2303576 RepID=UPI0013C302D3|nr:GFA family protein [Sphingomonas mesophila]
MPRAPDEILQCNCSVCRMSGFQGVYYRAGEVTVTGALDGYVRSDLTDPCMTMWRCATCGILTHWTLLDDWPYPDMPKPDRMGVNARLFPAELTDGLPVQHNDGASQ